MPLPVEALLYSSFVITHLMVSVSPIATPGEGCYVVRYIRCVCYLIQKDLVGGLTIVMVWCGGKSLCRGVYIFLVSLSFTLVFSSFVLQLHDVGCYDLLLKGFSEQTLPILTTKKWKT